MATNVTNADRVRWQRMAHQAVGEFLADAANLDLPAITWIVAGTGAITGRVDGLVESPDGQRATFRAWAAYLGATPAERNLPNGRTVLYATFERGALVNGCIRADIEPLVDDEGGESL